MKRNTNGTRAGRNGSKENGGAIAVAPAWALRRRALPPPPGEVPPTAVREPTPPRGWKWLAATAVGLLLASVLLGALAWIQPSLQSDQRVELPAAVRLVLSSQKAEKKRSKSQDLKKEEKPQAREERTRPREAPPPARRVAQTRQAAPPARPEMSALRNVSLFQGPGGAGAITLGLADLQDDEAVERAKDFAKYEERRRAIREGRAGGRSAGADGRQGRQLVDINVSQPRSEDLRQPRYPQRAIKEQVEGFVRMRLLISPAGRVERHEIIAAQPQGYFEESILEVLPSWQFTPALDESGRPIESWEDFNYVFKLEDAL